MHGICSTHHIFSYSNAVRRSDHLSTIANSIARFPSAKVHYSSFRVCKDERDSTGRIIVSNRVVKGRVDTSCVVHARELLKTYGLWKDRNEGGYAHDFEFVSRWNEEQAAFTLMPTVLYNISTNQQTFETILSIVGDPQDQRDLRQKLGLCDLETALKQPHLDNVDPSADRIESLLLSPDQ